MNHEQEQPISINDVMALRGEKLQQLREKGIAFPNQFRRDYLAHDLHLQFNDREQASLEEETLIVSIAGRIMMRRLMGKAAFIQLQDMSGQIQVYVRQDAIAAGRYEEFKHWDLGDIVGVTGSLFKTKTGELSVRADSIELLSKSLRPLPDKYHGLADQETRYRQRYLDLIVNPESRKVFVMRSKIIEVIRHFLNERDYMEVETPMMQPLAGGAAARPFVTHHNALDMQLFLRIAPELYLKRLVVGGFERVYEINRNFRNEGVSTRHNPEFTMLEFYQAYADYNDLIDLTEEMLRHIADTIIGDRKISYLDYNINLDQTFARMTLFDAILKFNQDLSADDLNDKIRAANYARKLGIAVKENDGLGKIQLEIFEKTVEEKLIQPTFITAYPAEVSPLARLNDHNSFLTDRFEFFIAGKEIANGFSELNDPEDQAARFREQVKAKDAGDIEAMVYDEDYITALEHGLPPTAGEGIGIDRLVMFFTNSASIRDVILFPHMRIK